MICASVCYVSGGARVTEQSTGPKGVTLPAYRTHSSSSQICSHVHAVDLYRSSSDAQQTQQQQQRQKAHAVSDIPETISHHRSANGDDIDSSLVVCVCTTIDYNFPHCDMSAHRECALAKRVLLRLLWRVTIRSPISIIYQDIYAAFARARQIG